MSIGAYQLEELGARQSDLLDLLEVLDGPLKVDVLFDLLPFLRLRDVVILQAPHLHALLYVVSPILRAGGDVSFIGFLIFEVR